MAERAAAEWITVEKLRPNPKNARKHPPAQIDGIAASIKANGFGRPILVRAATMEIIAGHGAFAAAKQLGLTHLPVRLLDVDAATAKRLAIADNRWAELSEWDGPALDEALAEMSADDLKLVGYDSPDDDLRVPLAVIEIDTSEIAGARFWMSISGPLPKQPDVLDALRVSLAQIEGVDVVFGDG